MMATTPTPDTLLGRKQAARALTDAGYPTSPATLATKASRGGGPIYRRFGNRVLYKWPDLLAWAESQTSSPRRSTSEAEGWRAGRNLQKAGGPVA
jgi:hypothetical protein